MSAIDRNKRKATTTSRETTSTTNLWIRKTSLFFRPSIRFKTMVSTSIGLKMNKIDIYFNLLQ